MIARSSNNDLHNWFQKVYRALRLIGSPESTIHKYNVIIRHYDRFIRRKSLITDLEEETIAEYMQHRLNHGAAPATVNGERAKLMAMANLAFRKGYIEEAPEVMRLRTVKRAPDSFTPEQFASLLSAAGDIRGHYCEIPGARFWTAFFLVMYDTSARPGVTWLLEWADYRPEIPAFLLIAENQKQSSDQLLKVSEQTTEALEAIRRPERKMVFPWLLCEESKYNHIARILKAAGLPTDRRGKAQKIRRTSLTYIHRAGGDATQQAGHSSNSVTRQYYIDPTTGKQGVDYLPRPKLPKDNRQRRLFD